jgi:hypothetical protein
MLETALKTNAIETMVYQEFAEMNRINEQDYFNQYYF